MNLTLPIPDELASRLGSGDELARRALEAFAVEEYRAGRLTHPDLRRLLGFGVHAELDAFLKAHGLEHSLADREKERQDPERLGTLAARIRAFRVGKTLGDLDPVELLRKGRR